MKTTSRLNAMSRPALEQQIGGDQPGTASPCAVFKHILKTGVSGPPKPMRKPSIVKSPSAARCISPR